jgi:hypothetical protein
MARTTRPQARRYPIACPSPGCGRDLAHDDVLHLLKDVPRDLQVRGARRTLRGVLGFGRTQRCAAPARWAAVGDDGHQGG